MKLNIKFIEDENTFGAKFDENEKDFGVNFESSIIVPYSDKAILYIPQDLTEEQQNQVKENIGITEIEDKNYVHVQYSAKDIWTIVHNLNKYPSVSVVDSGGSVVIGDIDYISLNECVVKFGAPFSGEAYLN